MHRPYVRADIDTVQRGRRPCRVYLPVSLSLSLCVCVCVVYRIHNNTCTCACTCTCDLWKGQPGDRPLVSFFLLSFLNSRKETKTQRLWSLPRFSSSEGAHVYLLWSHSNPDAFRRSRSHAPRSLVVSHLTSFLVAMGKRKKVINNKSIAAVLPSPEPLTPHPVDMTGVSAVVQTCECASALTLADVCDTRRSDPRTLLPMSTRSSWRWITTLPFLVAS